MSEPTEETEESLLILLKNKEDDRSDFDKAFEDDTLYSMQNRMLAKAKTKKFTPEEFIDKAKQELENETEIVETSANNLEETPEPEPEEDFPF